MGALPKGVQSFVIISIELMLGVLVVFVFLYASDTCAVTVMGPATHFFFEHLHSGVYDWARKVGQSRTLGNT